MNNEEYFPVYNLLLFLFFRDEVDIQEYNELKSEFMDQTKAVSEALERMNKGDVTINSKYSVMKQELRRAIATSFNTLDIIQIFGYKLGS